MNCPPVTAVQLASWDLSGDPGQDFALLDEREQERARRFLAAGPAGRFVRARGGLRRHLGAALGVDPRALRLAEGPNGRPELAGREDGALVFNLAHSGTRALLAWRERGPLGVDLEERRPMARLEEVAEEVLCPAELADWRSLAPPLREGEFLRAWTRKEAVLKALGVGLSGGLRTLDVRGDAPVPVEHLGVLLVLVDLELGPGFAAALCTAPPPPELCWRSLGEGGPLR